MLTTMDIARRIKIRFNKFSGGTVSSPIADGRSAYIDFVSTERTIRAYVSPIMGGINPRPAGFDHIFGVRPRYDQLHLAGLASKWIASMKKVSQTDQDLADLEPWHKNGIAGFVVNCTSGQRFRVDMMQVSVRNDMRKKLEEAIAMQEIDAADKDIDDFVAIDDVRIDDAHVEWDSASVIVTAPGYDTRWHDWDEVASIERNEHRDIIITFNDATSVCIGCRVFA